MDETSIVDFGISGKFWTNKGETFLAPRKIAQPRITLVAAIDS